MNIIERIYQIIEYYGISINEFSKRIGVSNGYFAKQKAVQGNVGSKIIEKIISTFNEVDTHWLLTGSGTMLKGNNNMGHSVCNSDHVSVKGNIGSSNIDLQSQLDNALKEIEFLHKEIELWQARVKDKDEIINMLRNK